MFGISAADIPKIGKLLQDPNGLKELIALHALGPQIFKAFSEAHPLNEGEYKQAVFMFMDDAGQLWINGAAMNEDGQPLRIHFQWNYSRIIKELNIDALLNSNKQIASGTLSWEQLKQLLKIKPKNG